ncbi:MAG: type II toxin-antitoxin system HicA family toxin [Elusimicrobia bacterium]|nr:type II toxin-antitoxin system HicA family toxin [Elusimicrobiota bacterium]
MKIPRDISGSELAKLLNKKYDYKITRQTGSHMRLTTKLKGEHHVTIPKHKFIKLGTLNNILQGIANYIETDKQNIIKELFG